MALMAEIPDGCRFTAVGGYASDAVGCSPDRITAVTQRGWGFAMVHLLPQWSAFSDSFVTNGASPIAYLVIFVQIVSAALFGGAGLYVLLGEHREAPSGRSSRAAQSFR